MRWRIKRSGAGGGYKNMTTPFYLVDAFAEQAFKGNPAAVCVLEQWPDDGTLLKMAQEHNQSETAFIIPRLEPDHYDIRWFTSQDEVDLCGHATLASSHVIFNEYRRFDEGVTLVSPSSAITLHSRESGDLIIRKGEDGLLTMDLPLRVGRQVARTQEDIPQYLAALDTQETPTDIFETDRDIYFVFDEMVVRGLTPNFSKMAQCKKWVGVTSRGSKNGPYDCVSRFFTPGDSHEEDPVTGSAHCTIAPYWARKMNKNTVKAFQASSRGGVLECTIKNDRVYISGRARTYMKGHIL